MKLDLQEERWYKKVRCRKWVFTITFLFLLLIVSVREVTAKCIAQTITLKEKNAPLEKVFAAIEKQSGYYFVYNNMQLKRAHPITIDMINASLEQILAICFKDQPFTYSIVDKLVVVKTIVHTYSNSDFNNEGPPLRIKGRVLNENGEPIAGVTVTIKGTKTATFTSNDGMFNLEIENKNVILLFTGSNIEPYSMNTEGRSDLIIRLTKRVTLLDEAVVIPYGVTTNRILVGNIGKVKAADIERQPVSNLLLALQGRVPGLFISQSSGRLGSGVTVRIEGQNSIRNGSDPLYIIDGVPINSQLLTTGVDAALGNSSGIYGGSTSGNGSPLSYINPGDIESVEILKDADATAIYGSRAANGAILITTKKGKIGTTKLDLNFQQGCGQITRGLKTLNTSQYLAMRREAKANDNAAILSTDYDINGLWDTTRYTNWEKTLVGNPALYTKMNASVSGGNSIVQYIVGGAFHRETSVYPGNFSNKQASFHFNITTTSANQRIRMAFSGNYMVDNNQLPNIDITSQAILFEPDAPALYNADGTLNWMPNSTGVSTFNNPLQYLYNTYSNKTNNLIGNFLISYQVVKGLEFKSSFGYTNMQTSDMILNPLSAVKPESRPTAIRATSFGSRTMTSWIIEPQVVYNKLFKSMKVNILLGATIQQNSNMANYIYGYGYNSDLLMKDIKSAPSLLAVSSSAIEYKYNAAFGRVNYSWRDKYIFDFTIRRDGSSRYGPENRFHNFGSTGVAWIFSEEPIFKKYLPKLSFGKLKFSYGTTGNDQFGDYSYLNLYSTSTPNVPYQNTPSLSVSGLVNPVLSWENTKKLMAGLDLGFINDRILLQMVYSKNKSTGQIISYKLPSIAGSSNVLENFPATVQNQTWELSVTGNLIKKASFSWTVNFNLTIPENKLLSFPNLSSSTFANSLIVGKSLTIVQLYPFAGVDPSTGQYLDLDSHGNPTIKPVALTDRSIILDLAPKCYGGIQNSINYKGMELVVFFQFVNQIGRNLSFYNGVNTPGIFSPGGSNQPVTVLERWQRPGDISAIQKFTTASLSSTNNATLSNYLYTDASYCRLKNISLSYQIPAKIVQSIRMQSLKAYVSAQNLLTFTKYKGLDPETGGTNLPPLQMVTVGIQAGL